MNSSVFLRFELCLRIAETLTGKAYECERMEDIEYLVVSYPRTQELADRARTEPGILVACRYRRVKPFLPQDSHALQLRAFR